MCTDFFADILKSATHCNSVLQCVAVCVTVLSIHIYLRLQHTATHCNSVLQCVAVCVTVLSIHIYLRLQHTATHCNSVLQCAAVCVTVLSIHIYLRLTFLVPIYIFVYLSLSFHLCRSLKIYWCLF